MVIAPDIPGFGASDMPSAVWSFAEYAVFIDSFLSCLDIDSVTVVGYSMGGGIAANLAGISHRVARLILVDSSGIYRAQKHTYHDLRRLFFYIAHPWLFAALFVLLRDYMQYAWKHRRDWARMRSIRRACFTTVYDGALRHVTAPTCLLWGRDDWIYPLEVAHAFQSLIPQATLKVVSGNHDWLVCNPALIKEFML
jgi:pimeloyl-ACP methyl ester carboxylesterase